MKKTRNKKRRESFMRCLKGALRISFNDEYTFTKAYHMIPVSYKRTNDGMTKKEHSRTYLKNRRLVLNRNIFTIERETQKNFYGYKITIPKRKKR